MKQRSSAVIISDGKIVLIKRLKPNEEYYTFPGGTVEEGESLVEAMKREIKEELSVDANIGEHLFTIDNPDKKDNYFLVEKCAGTMKLGGPELEKMNQDNQYIIEEVELDKLSGINIYPKEALKKIQEFLRVLQQI
ncbi:MAG: NUDIX domain-containing protein [bacterium]|nr:NUDIX domain-containing protein [bacterium]